jgi:hypothetical protein
MFGRFRVAISKCFLTAAVDIDIVIKCATIVRNKIGCATQSGGELYEIVI